MKHRLSLAAVLGIAAVALPVASASAAGTAEPLTGTTLGSLAITAGTGAILSSNFSPGHTASSTGLLTATDTSGSWTLKAKDAGTGAGHMVAAAVGCTGSDSQLANATSVAVTSPLGGVTSAGPVALSSTDQTVASASSQLLAANALTTNYSVVLPDSEVMLTGCVYSQNVTYTLQ